MSRQVTFYNTLTRKKDVFAPRNPGSVRMYVCGPTVYDAAHIGNARPAVVFDVVFRLLRQIFGSGNVVYARNITDVDDKIIARARRDFPSKPLNDSIRKVSERTERQYREDVTELGCLPPTFEPRATEHIETMKQLIERLFARGVAYVADQHVLFSPAAMNALPSAPPYGSLSRRPLDEMIAGARVEVAPYKRDPMDFVLWKPSSADEPGWNSPCGISTPGRPGWHIECSAMSMKLLLEPFGGGLFCDDPESNIFDIHGGGIDLVFPHHENEIAQSCCALGASRMADFWMHNGFLQVEGEKMSKSLGNFVTIRELLASDRFGGRAWAGSTVRLAMLRTHYRQPIDWTVRALQESERALKRFAGVSSRATIAASSPSQALLDALADDLNTPMAITHLHHLAEQTDSVEAAQQLRADAELLGFNLQQIYESDAEPQIEAGLRETIERLLSQRLEARRARNWNESDRLRSELSALGVSLKDTKDGTTWELAR